MGFAVAVAALGAGIVLVTGASYLSASFASAAGKPSRQSGISLYYFDWLFQHSNGMPSAPSGNINAPGWYFDFPVYNGNVDECAASLTCPSVNYLTTKYSSAIKGSGLTMSISVATSSGTVFEYRTNSNNTCTTPAKVRFFVQRRGDRTLTNENYRWWSNPVSYELTDGAVTLTAPLTPDQWSNVNGKFGNYDAAATAGFYDAFNNPERVGMTFGGGCFFGHGVFVTGGTARFTLTNYAILP